VAKASKRNIHLGEVFEVDTAHGPALLQLVGTLRLQIIKCDIFRILDIREKDGRGGDLCSAVAAAKSLDHVLAARSVVIEDTRARLIGKCPIVPMPIPLYRWPRQGDKWLVAFGDREVEMTSAEVDALSEEYGLIRLIPVDEIIIVLERLLWNSTTSIDQWRRERAQLTKIPGKSLRMFVDFSDLSSGQRFARELVTADFPDYVTLEKANVSKDEVAVEFRVLSPAGFSEARNIVERFSNENGGTVSGEEVEL
jgi:hypothetical protein